MIKQRRMQSRFPTSKPLNKHISNGANMVFCIASKLSFRQSAAGLHWKEKISPRRRVYQFTLDRDLCLPAHKTNVRCPPVSTVYCPCSSNAKRVHKRSALYSLYAVLNFCYFNLACPMGASMFLSTISQCSHVEARLVQITTK